MTPPRKSDTPPLPDTPIFGGLTAGDCMGMAAILQGDAQRTRNVGGPREVARVKDDTAALLEALGTGLRRLDFG